MITVFYDGKCSLCSKEVNHYQRIAPDCVFEWQDIATSVDVLKKYGISISESLRLLHAVDENGKLHVGVDAFILIWKQLQYWRVLAYVTSLPAIRQIASIIYRVFADWRFKRLKHCQIAAKQE